jgi:hypothetical protein
MRTAPVNVSVPPAFDGALTLAGFALAHAAWSIADGERLCTLAMAETGGRRELFRYEAPSIPASLENARTHLAGLATRIDAAALVFDGYASIDGRRSNALVVQVFAAGIPAGNRLIQRYRARTRSRRFRLVEKPELLFEGEPPFDPSDRSLWTTPLFAGIVEHEHSRHYWDDR